MTVRRQVVALVSAALLVFAPVAMARSVFLNGVDISGVKNQTFKNATVTIDHKGDVHVTAKGYKVQLVDQDAEPAAASSPDGGANPNLSTRFYLATTPSYNGKAQYDLVVAVNGVERKVIKAGSSAVIMEISAWFKKGQNKVTVTANKNLAGGRKSTAPTDQAQLIIGAGKEDAKKVKIEVVHVDFKCNAAQLSTITKTYTINAI